MSILDFRPHKLKFQIVTEGYEDENGDYHEGESSWSEEVIPCNAEAPGRASEISFEDGVVKQYSYVIHMDPDVRDFRLGERVMLCLSGDSWREFEVKGFHPYQYQKKLWV